MGYNKSFTKKAYEICPCHCPSSVKMAMNMTFDGNFNCCT